MMEAEEVCLKVPGQSSSGRPRVDKKVRWVVRPRGSGS